MTLHLDDNSDNTFHCILRFCFSLSITSCDSNDIVVQTTSFLSSCICVILSLFIKPCHTESNRSTDKICQFIVILAFFVSLLALCQGVVAFSSQGDRIALTQIEQMIDGKYVILGHYDTQEDNLTWTGMEKWSDNKVSDGIHIRNADCFAELRERK